MRQIAFRAMGCHMRALVDSDTPIAEDVLAQVPDWFAMWEQHLSRFRDDSELNELNRRAGEVVQVGQVLWDVLDVALQAAEVSDGLVVPTLLDALERAGYDRRFEHMAVPHAKRVGGHCSASVVEAHVPAAWRAITRDVRTRGVRLPRGVRLDLGGVAKGWAAARAVQRLGAFAPALVDAGGDIAVSSARVDGAAWPIAVANPHVPDEDVALVLLATGGIATSGCDYRRWQQGGVWQHHILDPRTGRPAQTDVFSASVIAPTVCEAETAAKVVVILGGLRGLAWLDAHSAFAGVLVLADGQVLHSHELQAYLWS